MTSAADTASKPSTAQSLIQAVNEAFRARAIKVSIHRNQDSDGYTVDYTVADSAPGRKFSQRLQALGVEQASLREFLWARAVLRQWRRKRDAGGLSVPREAVLDTMLAELFEAGDLADRLTPAQLATFAKAWIEHAAAQADPESRDWVALRDESGQVLCYITESETRARELEAKGLTPIYSRSEAAIAARFSGEQLNSINHFKRLGGTLTELSDVADDSAVKARRRRTVRCGQCRHFNANALNPGGGMGQCRQGLDESGPLPYPMTRRYCAGFTAALSESA